jgi:hypothetical protein
MPIRRWSVFADASFFVVEPSVVVDGTTRIAARIWPVGIGALVRWGRRRWQIAGGPRVSLQIADVDAVSADGRGGSARRYSAGLGGVFEGAWLFSRHVGALASVGAELLVPRLQFSAGGAGASDLGWVQFAFNLGLVFSMP